MKRRCLVNANQKIQPIGCIFGVLTLSRKSSILITCSTNALVGTDLQPMPRFLSDDETAILLGFFDDNTAIAKSPPPDLLNILDSLRSSLRSSPRLTPSIRHSAPGELFPARTSSFQPSTKSQVRRDSLICSQGVLTSILVCAGRRRCSGRFHFRGRFPGDRSHRAFHAAHWHIPRARIHWQGLVFGGRLGSKR